MGHSNRHLLIEPLRRRRLHLQNRVKGEPDGSMMYDRKELRALGYTLAVFEAARRLDLIDQLEADAHDHGDLPWHQIAGEARRLSGDERRA